MELVYLWVEKYKNIDNQGFNFSPRFECTYDEKTHKLNIDEDKEYVSIFPENINVTAIVGENGSGKSSLLELIMLLYFNSKNNNIEEKIWLLVYDKENSLLNLKSFNSENSEFNEIKINNSEIYNNSVEPFLSNKVFSNTISNTKVYNLFYNPSNELVSSNFLEYCNEHTRTDSASIYDIDFKPQDSLNIFAFPSKKNKMIDIQKNENTILLNMVKAINTIQNKNISLVEILKSLENEKINFIPKRVTFTRDLQDAEYQIKQEYFMDIVFEKYDDLSINSLYAYLITIVLSIAKLNFEDQTLNTFFFENKHLQKYLQNKLMSIKKDIPENDVVDPIYKLTKYILTNLEEFKKVLRETKVSLSELISSEGKRLNIAVYDTACLIDVLNGIGNQDILNRSLQDLKQILQILPTLPSFIKLNAVDKNGVHFSDFSSGEKNIINTIYSSVYYSSYYFNSFSYYYLNLFIDEIEIGLHPKWQKDIFTILIKLYRILKIKVNIFITSHSPFILSDIPKENVIFLEKGEQVDVDIETFGANIHTLLSNGFFMKDGLMGEFAKGEINKAISKLNQSKLSKDDIKFCENIIKITGEPIIKRQMQKMLDSKRLSKIDTIEKQIVELQKELQKMKDD